MDNFYKARLNDIIYNNISIRFAMIAMCSHYEREHALEIARYVCENTKDMLIAEIIEEDNPDSQFKLEGFDPKSIANEIVIQSNFITKDIIDTMEDTYDQMEEEEES